MEQAHYLTHCVRPALERKENNNKWRRRKEEGGEKGGRGDMQDLGEAGGCMHTFAGAYHLF